MNPYQNKLAMCNGNTNEIQIAMQKGLIKLYAKKDFTHITVKELCETTPVARTTFYTYYQNTDSLLEEIENDLLGKLLMLNKEEYVKTGSQMDIGLFLTNTLAYIIENKSLFWTFLIKQPNHRFIEKWKNALKYHFWNRYYLDGVKPNSELILEMIASAAIGAYRYWLMNPEDIDVDKFNRLIVMTFELVDIDI